MITARTVGSLMTLCGSRRVSPPKSGFFFGPRDARPPPVPPTCDVYSWGVQLSCYRNPADRLFCEVLCVCVSCVCDPQPRSAHGGGLKFARRNTEKRKFIQTERRSLSRLWPLSVHSQPPSLGPGAISRPRNRTTGVMQHTGRTAAAASHQSTNFRKSCTLRELSSGGGNFTGSEEIGRAHV